MPLTREQVVIIKSTGPVLKEHGNAITSTFYATLLKENPDLNNIFNHTNQINNHQPAALAASLYAYASHIDDLGALSPAVEKICQKHASLYVQPEHYGIVATYLLRAMGEVLGDALTPDILEAWKAAYWQLADLMIKREESILSETNGWTDWRDFKVAEKVTESAEITSFYLTPADGTSLPTFKPGQYISVMTHVPEFKYMQSRQYSLSDAPNPKYYRISVKKTPGVGKHHPGYLSNILHDHKQVGDLIKVSHPAGEFFLDPADEDPSSVVLISAGIGLTPMISILNTLLSQRSRRQIAWVHATRSTDVQAFHRYIQDTVKQNDNVTAVVFNKQPSETAVEGVDYRFKTRMDLDMLDKQKHLHLDNNATYYICGPEAFMKAMSQKLKTYGVTQARIHLEVFGTGMGSV